MREFGRYQLKTVSSRDTSVSVRLATPDDSGVIAAISEAAGSNDEIDPLFDASWEVVLPDSALPSKVLFVAEIGKAIAGVARTGYFMPPADAPDNCVPEGWYLEGVIVKPDQRGRGVGSFLTQSRLEWLADRTDVVRYFVSSRNTVSIELHKQLGFREVRRDVWAPHAMFEGEGTGVLYELPLERRRSLPKGMPVTVRLATTDDAEAISKLSVTVGNADELDSATALGSDSTHQPTIVLFVAEMGGAIAGFARADYFVPPHAAPDNCVPEGWYLQGVIVRPDQRGRGIASFLTQSRLEWLAARTNVVRYFTNSRNADSTELPRELGFRESRRGVWAPKEMFSGEGSGVLYELVLEARRPISQVVSN